jgi:hypothetical protein
VRFTKPRHQHPIFGEPVQHAIGTDDRGVHCARQNQNADNDDENVKCERQQGRTDQILRQTAQKVRQVFLTDRVGNDHAGK